MLWHSLLIMMRSRLLRCVMLTAELISSAVQQIIAFRVDMCYWLVFTSVSVAADRHTSGCGSSELEGLVKCWESCRPTIFGFSITFSFPVSPFFQFIAISEVRWREHEANHWASNIPSRLFCKVMHVTCMCSDQMSYWSVLDKTAAWLSLKSLN